MNLYLFNRAARILKNNGVSIEAVTSKAVYLTVRGNGDKYNVCLNYKDGWLKWDCDCRYSSIQGIPRQAVCSHILASMYYLINRRLGK